MVKERKFRKAKKNPNGRPTKLTDGVADEVLRYVTSGCYLETAAAACGVHRATLQMWLAKGKENPTGPYGKFRDLVEIALAKAEARDILIIGKAAEKSWPAAAWRLERKFPNRYGRVDRIPEPDEENNEDRSSFKLNYSLDDEEDETPKE